MMGRRMSRLPGLGSRLPCRRRRNWRSAFRGSLFGNLLGQFLPALLFLWLFRLLLRRLLDPGELPQNLRTIFGRLRLAVKLRSEKFLDDGIELRPARHPQALEFEYCRRQRLAQWTPLVQIVSDLRHHGGVFAFRKQENQVSPGIFSR